MNSYGSMFGGVMTLIYYLIMISYLISLFIDMVSGSNDSIKTKITNGDWNWGTATITARGMQALPSESIITCCCVSDCTQQNPCVSCVGLSEPLGVVVKVAWKDRQVRDRVTSLATLFTEP